MKISQIKLRGVATHNDTELNLPDKGVVLVTGNNGSGKSALIEAIPLTLWGKTLRGAKLWSESYEPYCSITADNHLHVERVSDPSKRCKLRWWENGLTASYDTTKDAQTALNVQIGSMEQWRRSCVLSSSDASNFTSMPDSERKRLIELIVGADKLEDGYRDARNAFHALEIKLTSVQSDLRVARVQSDAANKRLADLSEFAFSDVAAADPPNTDRKQQLQIAIKHVAEDKSTHVMATRAADDKSYRAKAKAFAAASEADRLAFGNCPTCNQPIPKAMREAANAAIRALEVEVQHAQTAVEDLTRSLQDELAGLDEEHENLHRQIRDIEHSEIRYDAWQLNQKKVEGIEERSRLAGQALGEAKAEVLTLQESLASVVQDVCVQKAAVKTLSTKGVRAHLVGQVIAAIEISANSWLARICHGDLELSLKPTSTKSDGKSLKEAVSLTIATGRAARARQMLQESDEKPVKVAPEAFRTYENASGGERRRIDIAIMFALAEVAEAAAGRTQSTLFCDELLDTLDTDGINAVCDALREISQDRCVVVISHNVTEKLKEVADRHIHITDGVLQAV